MSTSPLAMIVFLELGKETRQQVGGPNKCDRPPTWYCNLDYSIAFPPDIPAYPFGFFEHLFQIAPYTSSEQDLSIS